MKRHRDLNKIEAPTLNTNWQIVTLVDCFKSYVYILTSGATPMKNIQRIHSKLLQARVSSKNVQIIHRKSRKEEEERELRMKTKWQGQGKMVN